MVLIDDFDSDSEDEIIVANNTKIKLLDINENAEYTLTLANLTEETISTYTWVTRFICAYKEDNEVFFLILNGDELILAEYNYPSTISKIKKIVKINLFAFFVYLSGYWIKTFNQEIFHRTDASNISLIITDQKGLSFLVIDRKSQNILIKFDFYFNNVYDPKLGDMNISVSFSNESQKIIIPTLHFYTVYDLAKNQTIQYGNKSIVDLVLFDNSVVMLTKNGFLEKYYAENLTLVKRVLVIPENGQSFINIMWLFIDVADVNGDQEKEVLILFSTEKDEYRFSVEIFDKDLRLLRKREIEEIEVYEVLSHLIADIDSDGHDEVLLFNHNEIYKLDFNQYFIPVIRVYSLSHPYLPWKTFTLNLDTDDYLETVAIETPEIEVDMKKGKYGKVKINGLYILTNSIGELEPIELKLTKESAINDVRYRSKRDSSMWFAVLVNYSKILLYDPILKKFYTHYTTETGRLISFNILDVDSDDVFELILGYSDGDIIFVNELNRESYIVNISSRVDFIEVLDNCILVVSNLNNTFSRIYVLRNKEIIFRLDLPFHVFYEEKISEDDFLLYTDLNILHLRVKIREKVKQPTSPIYLFSLIIFSLMIVVITISIIANRKLKYYTARKKSRVILF